MCADKDNSQSMTVAKISGVCTKKVEPVGRWFEAYGNRKRSKQSLSYHSLNSSSSAESSSEVSEDEEDEHLLITLDPTDWKNQDHYAVFGLGKLRYRATDQQIKHAYKKKVLKHHPDKRRARGETVKEGDDDYFTCVTRAWEVLGISQKRRSYDSIDPKFDEDIPSQCTESRDDFYGVFGPVFEENSRWSNKKNVPMLGNEPATYEEVNRFYSFWYDFDSWREFSYLDEEDKEKGEDRYERRYIEKQNKAARQKRKKEEVVRIRELVDNAYACDPRIQRFKDEEKRKKLEQKKAKQDAARAKVEQEQKIRDQEREEELRKKEVQEEATRAKNAAEKKEREIQKKLLKKEKKTFRTFMKERDYFSPDEASKVNNMQDSDRLAELLSLESLKALNTDLASSEDLEKQKELFLKQVESLNNKLEEEKQKNVESLKRTSGEESGSKLKDWSAEETQLLIKAVNVFPAGTVQRWETVANFITQHIPTSNRSAKEVLAKAKDLQKIKETYGRQKAAVNEKAYQSFEQTQQKTVPPGAGKKNELDNPSERFVTAAEYQVAETGTNPAPWTAEEQKLLEQALKTYPTSTKDRWEVIASVIATRSKKDCMKRYKEIVEMVKAKKAAQAATAAKAKK